MVGGFSWILRVPWDIGMAVISACQQQEDTMVEYRKEHLCLFTFTCKMGLSSTERLPFAAVPRASAALTPAPCKASRDVQTLLSPVFLFPLERGNKCAWLTGSVCVRLRGTCTLWCLLFVLQLMIISFWSTDCSLQVGHNSQNKASYVKINLQVLIVRQLQALLEDGGNYLTKFLPALYLHCDCSKSDTFKIKIESKRVQNVKHRVAISRLIFGCDLSKCTQSAAFEPQM